MPGAIVDSNVHLWDQRHNPVFWLSDRTLVRDLLGPYDSLPDVYALDDYERETSAFHVRGIGWSDAGAADPVAAAEWVWRDDSAAMEHFARMAEHGLAATIEATSDQLGLTARLARQLPRLKIVVDHFGWPTQLDDDGRSSRASRRASARCCSPAPRRAGSRPGSPALR